MYFNDLQPNTQSPQVFRYDYDTGAVYSAYVVGETGASFIMPVNGSDNEFVVGFDGGPKVVRWDGKSTTAQVLRTLFTVPQISMDYAIADPKGRLFVGTFNSVEFCSGPSNQIFYRYTSNNILTPLFSDVWSSNGLAINRKTNKLYHSDACSYKIAEFDYNPKTGDICNGRVVFDFRNMFGNNTIPPFQIHGLDIDRNGLLYATLYEGGGVWVIDPR